VTDKRILLLGAHGYIGQEVLTALRKERFEVSFFDRDATDSYEKVKKFCPNIVINLAASKGADDFLASYEANLFFQLRMLKFLSEEVDNHICWIQVASYFELQIEEGRKDFYEVHKATLRKILEEKFFTNIRITTLFLPHIVSSKNTKSSLFTQIEKAVNGENVKLLTSGDQIVPILHIDDCVSAIIKSVDAEQGPYFATPVWNDNLKNLLQALNKRLGVSFAFTAGAKSIDWNFKRIDFNPCVPDWAPKKNIETIFDELVKIKDRL